MQPRLAPQISARCVLGGGVDFLLAHLMCTVRKAISFYMKKAPYNWKCIAGECSLLPRQQLCAMCVHYMRMCIVPGEGTCPGHSAPNNFVFPSVSLRGHICPTPPSRAQSSGLRPPLFPPTAQPRTPLHEKEGRQDAERTGTTHHKNIP